MMIADNETSCLNLDILHICDLRSMFCALEFQLFCAIYLYVYVESVHDIVHNLTLSPRDKNEFRSHEGHTATQQSVVGGHQQDEEFEFCCAVPLPALHPSCSHILTPTHTHMRDAGPFRVPDLRR
jgi:hypothetical protein